MTADASSLCKSCGLCCDGSLFWAVPLGPNELALDTGDGAGHLRQPCMHHDGVCSIYCSRPSGCRAFTCHVLEKVMAGTHNHHWAQDQIDGMRQAIDQLSNTLPGSDPSIYRRAAEFLSEHKTEIGTPGFDEEYSGVMRNIARFEQMWNVFHTANQTLPDARSDTPFSQRAEPRDR